MRWRTAPAPTYDAQVVIAPSLRPLLVAVLVLSFPAGTAFASQGAARDAAATGDCGNVVVDFEPEGSGGGMDIKARGITCKSARTVVTSCIKGHLTSGWTAANDRRTLMTKGDQRITYTLVGGGGCGAFPKRCADFSYRSVGFFNMHVLGPSCKSARKLARTWYDSTGRCSFAKACTIGDYRCKPNAAHATVTCRRANGYRVDWQMGE